MQKKCTYTPKEVAEILNLGTCKTYDLIHQNVIPSIKLGRKYIIPKEALEEWLKSACS
jgi:excisionase family DNA binding protein